MRDNGRRKSLARRGPQKPPDAGWEADLPWLVPAEANSPDTANRSVADRIAALIGTRRCLQRFVMDDLGQVARSLESGDLRR